MNIGASSITDFGLMYQWGDTSGYTASEVGTTKIFNWDYYKYGTPFSKYNTTDGKMSLDIEDDAARAAWGGS